MIKQSLHQRNKKDWSLPLLETTSSKGIEEIIDFNLPNQIQESKDSKNLNPLNITESTKSQMCFVGLNKGQCPLKSPLESKDSTILKNSQKSKDSQDFKGDFKGESLKSYLYLKDSKDFRESKNNKKAIFIGDRLYVLEAMLDSKIDVVGIFLYKDSYATKNLDDFLHLHTIEADKITIFDTKKSLISSIKKCNFDLLVSNGCPFILPILELKKQGQIFINIHPSLLPQLRGKNPINGAILFNKDAGVSVHTMDDEIDRGDILSQIKIPIKNLPLALLYKLCFKAEALAFKNALTNNFKPQKYKHKYKESYYTRPSNPVFPINISNDELLRAINAFSLHSQTSKIITSLGEIQVLKISKINNPYLDSIAHNYANYELVEYYEDNILIYKDGEFLELTLYPITQMKYFKQNKRILLWGGGIVNESPSSIYYMENRYAVS